MTIVEKLANEEITAAGGALGRLQMTHAQVAVSCWDAITVVCKYAAPQRIADLAEYAIDHIGRFDARAAAAGIAGDGQELSVGELVNFRAHVAG